MSKTKNYWNLKAKKRKTTKRKIPIKSTLPTKGDTGQVKNNA